MTNENHLFYIKQSAIEWIASLWNSVFLHLLEYCLEQFLYDSKRLWLLNLGRNIHSVFLYIIVKKCLLIGNFVVWFLLYLQTNMLLVLAWIWDRNKNINIRVLFKFFAFGLMGEKQLPLTSFASKLGPIIFCIFGKVVCSLCNNSLGC